MKHQFLKHSEWITSPVLGGPRTPSPAVYFRRQFSLDKVPGKTLLHITALGLFECEINGKRVSDDVLTPGWTDYHKRVTVYSYDITPLLASGNNVIGVILGNGWYSGHIAKEDRQFYGDQPAFLAAISDTENGGDPTLVTTDRDWRYRLGPILENDLLMGESYDARRELKGWSSPDYDEPLWQPVHGMDSPHIELDEPAGPPVRRQEILVGEEVEDTPQARMRLFDFGQNFTGRVRFRVKGKRGCHLRIRHGEMLDQNGSLYTANLRSARATDNYTLRGGDTEEWEPRFTFHGFRYAEFTWNGKDSDVSFEKVEGVVLNSDMRVTGEFGCSHPLLNQLTHNILWGQKGNFLEIPTDCPQRDERLGWTGDAQVFCRTAAFFMDVRTFFHKWLRDLRDSQSPEGAIPPFAPNTCSFDLPRDGGPAWADVVFICPWTLYLVYGDKTFLEANYGAMVRYLDYLAGNKVKDYIRPHPDLDEWGGFGDWLALDGSGKTDGGTPKELIGTAFYAHGADIASKVAGILGREKESQKYRDLHDKIVAAFRKNFVTPEGHVIGGTQTSYVLALKFGLIPEKSKASAAKALVRLIEGNGWRIGTGFVGTPYILEVLESTGYLEVAYRLLEQEAFPSWLFPVKHGATTIWERWDGWTPDKGFQDVGMNSFNHYAYGAVGAWMVSTVAGLEIDEANPGYQHILFKPRPGGTITRARAQYKTPHGTASISWELGGETLKLKLVVPEGSSATLQLDSPFPPEPISLDPGTHEREFASSRHR